MRLYYMNGEKAGQFIELPPQQASIGRELDNSIQLPVAGVSRYHAIIDTQDNGASWIITDLQSTNGTRLNGALIESPALLTDGDVINIGDQVLRFTRQSDLSVGRREAPAASAVAAPEQISSVPSSTVAPEPAPEPVPKVIFRAPAPLPTDPGGESDSYKKEFMNETLIPKPPAPSGDSDGMIRLSEGGAPSGQGTHAEKSEAVSAATEAALRAEDFFKKKEEGEGAFFSKKNRPEKDRRKHRRNNLLFYLLVVLLVALSGFIYVLMNAQPQKNINGERRKGIVNPFLLGYEKQIMTDSSVFRLNVLLEGDTLELTLDDPEYGRHYFNKIKLKEETVRGLETKLAEYDTFMTLEQNLYPGGLENVRRRILLSYGDKLNEISVNSNAPASFEKVERQIIDFLDQEGYGSLAREVNEILQEAESSFKVAEDAFMTHQAVLSNLYKSLVYYRITLKNLEQFENKPEIFRFAGEKVKTIETMLDEIKEEGRKNVNLFIRQENYAQAAAECERLLQIFPSVMPKTPADEKYYEAYNNIKKIKISIERQIK